MSSNLDGQSNGHPGIASVDDRQLRIVRANKAEAVPAAVNPEMYAGREVIPNVGYPLFFLVRV